MTGIAYSLKKDITFLYFTLTGAIIWGVDLPWVNMDMVCYVSFGLWYIALSLDCDDAAL